MSVKVERLYVRGEAKETLAGFDRALRRLNRGSDPYEDNAGFDRALHLLNRGLAPYEGMRMYPPIALGPDADLDSWRWQRSPYLGIILFVAAFFAFPLHSGYVFLAGFLLALLVFGLPPTTMERERRNRIQQLAETYESLALPTPAATDHPNAAAP